MKFVGHGGGRTGLVAITSGRMLQIAFSFISIRIATTILDPAQMGRYNVISTIGTVLVLFLGSSVGAYWNRKLHFWQQSGYLFRASCYFLGYFVVATLLAIVGTILISSLGVIGIQIGSDWLIWVVFSGFLLASISNVMIGSANLLHHRMWYVGLTNLVSWGGLLLSVALVQSFGPQAEWWYSGPMLVRLLVVAGVLPMFLLIISRQASPASIDGKDVIAEVWRFSSPLLIYSVFYFLQFQSYPFVFAARSNEAALGLFAVGFGVGLAPMIMFSTLFTEYYNPFFYKGIAHDDISLHSIAWNEYASAYLPAAVAFGIFVVGAGSLLTRLLVGPDFQQVGWLVPWGASQQILVIVFSLLNLGAQARLRTDLMIIPAVLGAVTTQLLLFLMLPISPLLGAAIALCSGALINTLGMIWLVRRVMLIAGPWRRILQAIVLSLPILIVSPWLQRISGTMFQTLAFLFGLGLYAFAVQLVLSRDWLWPKKEA